MIRLPGLLLLTCTLAPAQFYDLATTDDGSIVYFATEHRRVGTDDPFQGRIWAVDAAGLRLVAERQRQVVTPSGGFVATFTNFYDLGEVSVSGDGSTLAFSARRDCTLSNRCGGSEVIWSSTVRTPASEIQLDGVLQLSPNGRFALVHGLSHTGGALKVVDLSSGESAPVPGSGLPDNPAGRLIADDGSYVQRTGSVSLRRFDGSPVLEIPSTSAVETAIDALATRIVFVTRAIGGLGFELRTVNVMAQEQQTLFQSSTEIRNLVMDRAGATAAFLARPDAGSPFAEKRPQVFVANLSSGDVHALPGTPFDVRSFTLSGDGKTVFAVSERGELLRIQAPSGDTSVLIPRTLDLDLAGGTTGRPDITVAAGSFGEITGAGFVGESAAAAETPLPNDLGGVSITIGGYEAPLLAVHPNLIRFQTPWELATGGNRDLWLPVAIAGAAPLSPFEPPPMVAWVREDWPRPLFGPDAHNPPLTLAAEQDFGALVTRAHPATPGDIVHLYLTGLGPVDNEPPTGHAAPSWPQLPATREPVVCGSTGHEWPILYAGLAPGLVGVYQLTVQIPSDAKSGPDGTTGTACFTSSLLWAPVNVPVRPSPSNN